MSERTPLDVIASVKRWDGRPAGVWHADMIIRALDAAGYVIVPKEPTPEMTRACRWIEGAGRHWAEVYWANMLAASQQKGG